MDSSNSATYKDTGVFDYITPHPEVVDRVWERRNICGTSKEMRVFLEVSQPFVVYIDDPAISIPITANDDAAARRVDKIPLLLRPQVTVGNIDTQKSMFGAIRRFAEIPIASDTPAGHNAVMKNNCIVDNDDDDEYADYDNAASSISKMSTTQTSSNPAIIYTSSPIFLTGCMGNGKSYVMRELALRSASKYPNIRVAYIPDCRVWSRLGNYKEQLKYLTRALSIAFALDKTWAQSVEDSINGRISDGTNDLQNIIKIVGGVCKDIGKNIASNAIKYEGGLLLCVDNYHAADSQVKNIVMTLINGCRRIMAVIATSGNQPIANINATTCTISSYYSPSEARALLDWISQNEDNVLPDVINTSYSDALLNIAREYTWLYPRDIAQFFTQERCHRGAKALGNYSYNAVNDQVARDANIRQYLEDVTNSIVNPLITNGYEDENNAIRKAYFCLYHSLRPKAELFKSSSHASGVEPTSPFFQVQSPSLYGETIGNNLLSFVSPRVAEYVFGQLNINVEDMIRSTRITRADLQKHQVADIQTEYEMGYALMLHWLHRGPDILGLSGASQKVHLLHNSYPSFADVSTEVYPGLTPGIHNKGIHTYSNTNQDYSSMRGVDFITYSDQGRPIQYYIVGLEISGAEFEDILRVFAANLDFGSIENDSRASTTQTIRICSGIKQAHDYHLQNDVDKLGECKVYIMVSNTVGGRRYNPNDLFNQKMNIRLNLLNADNI